MAARVDGRLLATFPAKGNGHATRCGPTPRSPTSSTVSRSLASERTARTGGAPPGARRRGRSCTTRRAETPCCRTPKVRAFLAEWGAIYERFGVPADIGLAQVILESGLNGTRRSEANAVGFCQWLQRNWKRLNHFSPTSSRERTRRRRLPYCAAYLSRACHQVRLVHSRALRTQRRRHERGEDADQRRAPRRRGCPRQIFSGLETGPRPSRAAGQGIRGRAIEPMVPARISMPRWSSATRSSSGI